MNVQWMDGQERRESTIEEIAPLLTWVENLWTC